MAARLARPALAQWLKFAAALYALNFALSFHNVWPSLWITTRHELSVEIAALLVALAVHARLSGQLSRRALNGLALLLTLMCIGRYAEVTAPAVYGRRINLYWDAQHLPGVAAMLADTLPPWQSVAIVAGILGLPVAIFVLLRWCLRRVEQTVGEPRGGVAIGSAAALLLTVYLLEYTPVPVRVWQWFSLPVSTTYWRQASFVHAAWAGTRTGDVPAPISLAEPGLERVKGADVLVVFVESYGATAYDDAAVAERLEPSRRRLEADASATGRRVASAFIGSPTFGGGSWLAHMSFFTGLDVRDQSAYTLLLTQERDTLMKRFAAEDYRVVALMPGLKSAWPEGAFYGLETIYGERALGYPGPDFGWWRIPDQFSLASLATRELERADRAPLFLFFPTISTHMPFRPTPPYEPDWVRLASPQPYAEDALERALAAQPEWMEFKAAYGDSLAYSFDYLSGFLRQRAAADLVLVLIGDHQPPATVSGQDARWDVPVHVISSRGAIVDDLLAAGFSEGTTPREPEPLAAMHELTELLLRAFSAAPAELVSER